MGNQGQEPPLLGLVTAPARRGYCRLLTAGHRYSRLMTDTTRRYTRLLTAPARRGYPRYVTDAARCYSGLVTMAASEEAFARASGLCRRRPR